MTTTDPERDEPGAVVRLVESAWNRGAGMGLGRFDDVHDEAAAHDAKDARRDAELETARHASWMLKECDKERLAALAVLRQARKAQQSALDIYGEDMNPANADLLRESIAAIDEVLGAQEAPYGSKQHE